MLKLQTPVSMTHFGGRMMLSRFAKAEDEQNINDMKTYCFYEYHQIDMENRTEEQDKKELETDEKKKEKAEALRWILVSEDKNGKIGQHVQIVPLTIYFDGELCPMAGIGGVASLPEYRYGGGVIELMRMSLQVMRERGYPLSELAPFSYEFYRKCGWEWGFQWYELKIPMKELACFKANTGTFVRLSEDLSLQAMCVHNVHGSRFNGAENMDDKKIKETMRKKNLLGYGVVGDDGQLSGYALYYIKNRVITCREFFYIDIQAKKQMLNFFYRHNSQADTLVLTVPESDKTLHLLGNHYLDMSANSGMMVRVVDVPKALAAMKVDPHLSGSVHIQIKDEFAPWNHGIWLVTITNGRLIAKKEEDSQPDCIMTIQRFSQLVYGFISGKEMIENGLVDWQQEAPQALFSKVFTKRPTAQWIPF